MKCGRRHRDWRAFSARGAQALIAVNYFGAPGPETAPYFGEVVAFYLRQRVAVQLPQMTAKVDVDEYNIEI